MRADGRREVCARRTVRSSSGPRPRGGRGRAADAVTAEYPGATVERLETDSGGVYEAHIVTSDGRHVVVQVGSDHSVTGTEVMGAGTHRHGGPRSGDEPGQQDPDG